MKNKVRRTILLLAISAVLFGVTVVFPFSDHPKIKDFINGASAGLALAGCVSFVILMVEHFKTAGKSGK